MPKQPTLRDWFTGKEKTPGAVVGSLRSPAAEVTQESQADQPVDARRECEPGHIGEDGEEGSLKRQFGKSASDQGTLL